MGFLPRSRLSLTTVSIQFMGRRVYCDRGAIVKSGLLALFDYSPEDCPCRSATASCSVRSPVQKNGAAMPYAWASPTSVIPSTRT
jgi:hypothetical protein